MNRFVILYGLVTASLVIPLFFMPSHAKGINDTGISFRGEYPKGNSPTCLFEATSSEESTANPKAQALNQQDCGFGRSKGLSSESESVFSYRKINKEGKILPDSADIWQCVSDQVTGLMWEVKNDNQTDSSHHNLHKFTWYNSNHRNNGGKIGDWNKSGEDCFGFKPNNPRSYCHIEQYASRINKKGLCGFYDWRVPMRQELTSLVHFGRNQPAIDIQYFPYTLNTYYWTLNPLANRPIEAWSVDFEFGTTSPLRKTDKHPVRLVRTNKQKEN